MDVEPQNKHSANPRAPKGDECSSANSIGDEKVVRTLNLTCLEDIASQSESIRTNAYKILANKFLAKDIRQFMPQIKQNAVRESSPALLKLVLQVAKKYANNGVAELELMEFLTKHDWKKNKTLLQ